MHEPHTIRIQTEDFDPGVEIATLQGADTGAVATFIGTVRDHNADTRISELRLETYPAMANQALRDIIAETQEKWHILRSTVVHRYGSLKPGDRIVFVGIASEHRRDAFAACEYIMDYLKVAAPFWKQEATPAGARWLDARASDAQAAARWKDK